MYALLQWSVYHKFSTDFDTCRELFEIVHTMISIYCIIYIYCDNTGITALFSDRRKQYYLNIIWCYEGEKDDQPWDFTVHETKLENEEGLWSGSLSPYASEPVFIVMYVMGIGRHLEWMEIKNGNFRGVVCTFITISFHNCKFLCGTLEAFWMCKILIEILPPTGPSTVSLLNFFFACYEVCQISRQHYYAEI